MDESGKTRTGRKIIRRMNSMANEKNCTREEIRAIVDKELRKANLNPAGEIGPDEMNHAAGGKILPGTHEEIDTKWDMVEVVLETYGIEAASVLAADLGLIDQVTGWGYLNDIQKFTIPFLRKDMHSVLDGGESRLIR